MLRYKDCGPQVIDLSSDDEEEEPTQVSVRVQRHRVSVLVEKPGKPNVRVTVDDESSEEEKIPETKKLRLRQDTIPLGEFKVVKVKDFCLENGQPMFLVEWDGWPGADTWEPLENIADTQYFWQFERFVASAFGLKEASKNLINFKNLLNQTVSRDERHHLVALYLKLVKKSWKEYDKDFAKLRDQVMTRFSFFLKNSLPVNMRPATMECLLLKELEGFDFTNFIERRRDAEVKNNLLEEKIRMKMSKFSIENLVDDDVLQDFRFIDDYQVGSGSKVRLHRLPLISCQEHCSCDREAIDDGRAYAGESCPCLMSRQGDILYECNDDCLCKDKCMSRVCSKNSSSKMTVFKGPRGWSVRTDCEIPRGQWVMNLTGELRLQKEMEPKPSLKVMRLSLAHLDQDMVHVVDMRTAGNLSRFVTHSCDPNLESKYFFSGNYNLYQPRVALFAKKRIEKGEELTLDYGFPRTFDGKKKCLCEAKVCRYFIY